MCFGNVYEKKKVYGRLVLKKKNKHQWDSFRFTVHSEEDPIVFSTVGF